MEIRMIIEEKVEKRAEKGKDTKSIYKREGCGNREGPLNEKCTLNMLGYGQCLSASNSKSLLSRVELIDGPIIGRTKCYIDLVKIMIMMSS